MRYCENIQFYSDFGTIRAFANVQKTVPVSPILCVVDPDAKLNKALKGVTGGTVGVFNASIKYVSGCLTAPLES